MTFPRLEAIERHWEKTPPLAVSVWAIAESLGVERKKAHEPQESPHELFEMLGSTGGFKAERTPEWLLKLMT